MSAHLERARTLEDLEKWSEAEREVRRHLADEPEDVEAHQLLASILMGQREVDGALEAARTAVSLGPDDAESHAVLGEVLWMRHESEEAEQSFREAVRLAPTWSELRRFLSVTLCDRGAADLALAEADAGLRLSPDCADLQVARGRAMWKLQRREEAESCFAAALRLDPVNEDAHAELGSALAFRGERDRAVGHLREALRIKPNHSRALSALLDLLKLRYPWYGSLLVALDRRAESAPRAGLNARWLLVPVALLLALTITREHHLDRMQVMLLTIWALGLTAYALRTLVEPLFDLALHLSPDGSRVVPADRVRSGYGVGGTILLIALVAHAAYTSGRLTDVAVLTLLVLIAPNVRYVFCGTDSRMKTISLAWMLGAILVGLAGAVLMGVPGFRAVGWCLAGLTGLAAAVFGFIAVEVCQD